MSERLTTNQISGRSAFISLLRDEGVTTLFGNPGTTELPIMDALSEQSDIGYVMGMQEAIVVAMADGYARASGRLAVCNVHVAPGLGNAMGSLFTAMQAGSPLLITAGQQEQGHGLTEPLLYAPLVPIAEPMVKWAVEVNRIEDLPRVMRRAAKVALTEPTGPVFISLPGDILNTEAPLDLGAATRVDTTSRPTAAAVDALANRLLSARAPVIVAGHEVVASDAFEAVGDFATALGAPAYKQTVDSGAHFPSEHPAYIGTLPRNQARVREVMSAHDVMICVGSDVLRMSVHSEVDPLPETTAVIQIGQRDWELGKNYPAEIAIRADVRETLVDLVAALRRIGGEQHSERAAAAIAALAEDNWSARRARRYATAMNNAKVSPMAPDWLMAAMVDNLPDNSIVVDEGITSASALLDLLPFRHRYSYIGNISGGIGWGVPAAVGVALARPEARVTAIIGDGSAMYNIQALWSAAKHKLPITYVIANNGGYRIIKQRLKSFHDNDNFIGMDFADPPVNPSKLAEGLGMRAIRAETPDAFVAAMQEATKSDGPVLIDALVQGHV
ncbi:Benzoylformate decarboxylase [Marinovum algicola]|uniref:Benzoylformate decarboxylase n=1 Tax=Marinovum algicola TaxID=42444 RepID=A0A975ZQT8_9RHOB|nr:thiamine pyrophosphate-binding protein [Marinovum algicola]SEK08983.1 benzoylformate decarboxylase [Marinovum algicola]SLN71867.1 Benzoylformate decarboxylase [Marinovum algicola]